VLLGRTIDALSQVLNPFLNELPVDVCPLLSGSLRSDVISDSIFHVGSVPLHWLYSWKTRWKSARFHGGAKLEPLSWALPQTFAFSSILYPLSNSAFLAVGLLRRHQCLRRTYRAYRVPSVRDTTQQGSANTPVGLASFAISPIHPDSHPRTFWLECVSLISLFTSITKLIAIRCR